MLLRFPAIDGPLKFCPIRQEESACFPELAGVHDSQKYHSLEWKFL